MAVGAKYGAVDPNESWLYMPMFARETRNQVAEPRQPGVFKVLLVVMK